ncbi:hypothetical protein [Pseudoxanthomonas japonensis]|uniref:hypothetical protein n=1 Tax=Pseudoxanthomonas japonensis TaxID=69284 RepID=UPI001BCF68A9|nr:hypothetical protein [Pseudoxanthomonas japonensis]
MIPLAGSAKEGSSPQVWQLRDDCDRPTVVYLRVDAGKTRLLEARMPLCKGSREPAAESKPPIDFAAPGIATRFDIPQDAALTGSLWVAGAEPDGVILGISFHTEERVLLNTMRFVPSSTASQSDIMEGVRLSTSIEASGQH